MAVKKIKVGSRQLSISKKRWILLGILITALIVTAVIIINNIFGQKVDTAEVYKNMEKVERRDVIQILKGSGTIVPIKKYNVMSQISGNILSADFEEGDIVEKDQVLYLLDTKDIQNTIDSVHNSIDRAETAEETKQRAYVNALAALEDSKSALDSAQRNYDQASNTYQSILGNYKNGNLLAEKSGIVSEIHVKEGQKITEGTILADIYIDKVMILRLPFLDDTVEDNWIGKKAVLEIGEGLEKLTGKVIEISDSLTVNQGNQVARMVSIKVNNPGGISTNTKAFATVDGVYCSGAGEFSYGLEDSLIADKSGTIKKILFKNKKEIKKGESIIQMDVKKIDEYTQSYKTELNNYQSVLNSAKGSYNSARAALLLAEEELEKAGQSISDAKDNYENEQKVLENYAVTAAISGRIVKKVFHEGERITSYDLNQEMAVIYDVSSYTFEMLVDELDIKSVKEGQKVNVTAKALPNESYQGFVKSISLISAKNSGVTQYPVTVEIKDAVGNILPGMNVNAEIEVSEKIQVLVIPSDALMKDDMVYVKDESMLTKDSKIKGYRPVNVQIGISDGEYIEIINGLADDDYVFVDSEDTAVIDDAEDMNE